MPDDTERAAVDRQHNREMRRTSDSIERLLVASLWLAYLPVVFLLLTALGAFGYGIATFFNAFSSIFHHPFPVGHNIGLFLLDFDLFLIGATALISAIGFYELFLGDIRDGRGAPLPGWLAMRDLNDLKGRVVSMIVLVLAVTFVEDVVDAPAAMEALQLGAGITLVIIALGVFIWLAGHGGGDGSLPPPRDAEQPLPSPAGSPADHRAGVHSPGFGAYQEWGGTGSLAVLRTVRIFSMSCLAVKGFWMKATSFPVSGSWFAV